LVVECHDPLVKLQPQVAQTVLQASFSRAIGTVRAALCMAERRLRSQDESTSRLHPCYFWLFGGAGVFVVASHTTPTRPLSPLAPKHP